MTVTLASDKKKCLEMLVANRAYLNIHDFDEHFADVTLDWTNKHI